MATDYDGLPDETIWSIQFNDLEFTQEIARGSFGKVFRGGYLGLDVAIKQIIRHKDPAYMKYIEREISVLKGLRHPLIVGFLGVSLHDSGLYIVTDFIEGGDVRAIIKSTGMSWPRRIQIAVDLAKTMYYLHSKNVIHRDLKSKNLLVAKDGRMRLCDFGFARTWENRGAKTMTICGTPGFVAPEIMLGDDYDQRCDVFSYGNVLAELITFQRPGKDFWVRSAEDGYRLDANELKLKAQNEAAAKGCPEGFLDLTISCVAYDPILRPDFSEIISTLDTIVKNNPVKNATIAENSGNRDTRVASIHTIRNSIHPSAPKAPREEPKQQTGSELKFSPDGPSDASALEVAEKHLHKMIYRAVNPEVFELEYLQDLLLCFPCFATPPDVLRIIIDRFTAACTESFNGPPNSAETKKHQLISMRIIVFLNTWIEKFPQDFEAQGMAHLIAQFDNMAADSLTEGGLTSARGSIMGGSYSIQNSLVKAAAKAPIIPSLPSYESKRTTADPNQISAWTAKDIGRQITWILWSQLRAIQPREYLKENWKTARLSNHIAEFKQSSQDIERFLVAGILNCPNKEGRVQLINKYVEVAQQCFNLKNYQGVACTVQALSHPSVERLGQTWSMVKPQTQATLKPFRQLIAKDNQYSAYRAKQESSPPPCIPWLDVHLEEIAYVDSFNPDIGKGGIINFSKHRKIGRFIRTLEQYSTAAYSDVTPNEPILKFILNHEHVDDDILSKRSLNCERPTGFG
eukprot:TRINITY_DN7782_c0_g1_i1.p1 TRINITY_DN7782_c0_g1~~TRINITY_DN7782_c0_g1_i1.p1  ORF type:complete len:743 (+),score=206.41 TRINITY_DN7782_c0_g1_i1:36-2264(+)